MGVESEHPAYTKHAPEWGQMRDTYEGERTVKGRTFKYLAPTSGMEVDGVRQGTDTTGRRAYAAYLQRSVFPELVKEAVEALLGVMHHKPATIELPESMEYLLEEASTRNESLQMFLRRINEEQLAVGRLGVLADVVDTGDKSDQMYLSLYKGEDIRNWDEGRRDGIEVQNLNLVVLDETCAERGDDFEWKDEVKYRVLMLPKNESPEAVALAVGADVVDGDEAVTNLPSGSGVYVMGVFRGDGVEFDPENMIAPSVKGRTSEEIPFVFVNTKDIAPEPDNPPLMGLSNLSLTIYRGEADYRQALFMQGQDTLVTIGLPEDYDKELRTGAGGHINIPNTDGGDAKYIGVDSTGLAEMRSGLENDYSRAGSKGGQLLDSVSGDAESGRALRIRVAAKTATLNQIALTGAFALQHVLRSIARWIGTDPETVKVTPNLDFVDDQMSGRELNELMAGKLIGAPIALESIHAQMQQRGMTDMKFEDEVKLIEEEREKFDLEQKGSSNPDGPEDDPEPEPEPADAKDPNAE